MSAPEAPIFVITSEPIELSEDALRNLERWRSIVFPEKPPAGSNAKKKRRQRSRAQR